MAENDTKSKRARKHISMPGGWDKVIDILDDETIENSRKVSLIHWLMTHTIDDEYSKDMEVPEVEIDGVRFARYAVSQTLRFHELAMPENDEAKEKKRIKVDKIRRCEQFLIEYYNDIFSNLTARKVCNSINN